MRPVPVRPLLAALLLGCADGAPPSGPSEDSPAGPSDDTDTLVVDTPDPPVDTSPSDTGSGGETDDTGVLDTRAADSAAVDTVDTAPHLPPVDLPPIAVVTDTTAGVGELVTLDGTASVDPEGAPLTFAWTFRSRPPLSLSTLDDPTLPTPGFPADRAGLYVIDLVVDDGVHTSPPATALVLVTETTTPPVAQAGPSRTIPVSVPVGLSGLGSFDPLGLPLDYLWTVVLQPPGATVVLSDPSAAEPTLEADTAGTVQVQLVVHNGSLPSAPSTLTLDVVDQPPPDPGDVAGGVLNPDEVYLVGTPSPGDCTARTVVHWDDPDVGVAGFGCTFAASEAKLTVGGMLLHTHTAEDVLRSFTCDGCPGWSPADPPPADPLANDPVLSTPPCDGTTPSTTLQDWWTAPDGTRIHECGGAWYDQAGAVLALSEDPLAMGYGGLALLEDALVDTATGATVPVTGLPGSATILAARSDGPDAFHVATRVQLDVSLWSVDTTTGAASLVLPYASPPPGTSAGSVHALDGAGNLLQLGDGPGGEDVLIRRTTVGLSEVLYSEADGWDVELAPGALITGP